MTWGGGETSVFCIMYPKLCTKPQADYAILFLVRPAENRRSDNIRGLMDSPVLYAGKQEVLGKWRRISRNR